MRLVTRNSKRPNVNSFPSLWNELFADDFFTKEANKNKNACNVPSRTRYNTSSPAVNIKDTAEHYFIEIAAPGFKKSDFLVELEDNTLTISTKKVEEKGSEKEAEKTEKETYTHREFVSSAFKRAFTIPEKAIEVDQIKASYDAGVLLVSIPKKEMEETKLNIDVL